MKITLFVAFAAALLVLSLTTSAHADSFLSISVNGGAPTIFMSALDFINTGPVSIGGVTFANISLAGNQPGSTSSAFSTDTKTAATNTTGLPASIVVGFASSNYSLPAGSPLQFNTSQSVTVVDFAGGGAISQTFVGRGDSSNSLVPGTGVPAPATTCSVAPTDLTNSCSITSALAFFTRGALFGENGIEMFGLAPGQVADFQAAINVAPVEAVPEPGTLLLLGTGMILVAGRGRLRKK
jgi:hypothetical protein